MSKQEVNQIVAEIEALMAQIAINQAEADRRQAEADRLQAEADHEEQVLNDMKNQFSNYRPGSPPPPPPGMKTYKPGPVG